MKELVTIVTAHFNATKFLEVSLDALMKLTKSKSKVIICDNGSTESEIKKLKEFRKNYPNVEIIFRQQSAPGNIGHGEALNILVNMIDTKYGVFLESDAIFLKKGWDEIMINILKGKTKIVGCLHSESEFTPTDFPWIFATMFDTKTIKNLDIDMMPKDISKGQDVGWEMREKFRAAGYESRIFEARNTREYKQSPFNNIVCGVYYFKDILIASHFGRGSTLGMAKYCKRLRIPLIKNMVRKIKGHYEREKWLRICKEIVDKESVS